MTATAESISAAALRLRGEANTLRSRPAAEVLDALCRVLDAWHEPASDCRRDLTAALSAEVGFSSACVREGLARGLAGWSGPALRELVARELGEPSGWNATATTATGAAGRPRLVSGFELTAVVLAGAIPMPTLLAILLPLVLRSPVLVKTSSRDPVTARHVAESIAREDRQLGRCVEVLAFRGDDDACANAFLKADCVVAMGSDATLERVASRVRPPQRLVPYGHRLSVSLLGPESTSQPMLAESAERIALDTALWDQQGCLSPAAVYVVGSRDDARKSAVAIAAALAQAEQRWPRGRIDTAGAAAIVQARSEAEIRAAALEQDGVEVFAGAGTSWTLVLERDCRWRATPLQRFLRVYPIDAGAGSAADTFEILEALAAALRPIAPHLAAVALGGFGKAAPAVSQLLADLGASRVCRAGQLQAPPLAWHHDGQPLLLPLARLTDLET